VGGELSMQGLCGTVRGNTSACDHFHIKCALRITGIRPPSSARLRGSGDSRILT
jgi:hypothetical protein